jgi:hypothetical protein
MFLVIWKQFLRYFGKCSYKNPFRINYKNYIIFITSILEEAEEYGWLIGSDPRFFFWSIKNNKKKISRKIFPVCFS